MSRTRLQKYVRLRLLVGNERAVSQMPPTLTVECKDRRPPVKLLTTTTTTMVMTDTGCMTDNDKEAADGIRRQLRSPARPSAS